ncbi:MAG: hypothetical protein ABH875_04125 [Candidatus Omnitrophota bacterium]
MDLKRPVAFAVLTMGATSIAAQIVLLRELIIVFYGNEISVGILLAGWLLLSAAGSLISAKLIDKIKSHLTVFCACQLLLSAALPFLVILVRHIRAIFGFLPGEIIPLGALAFMGPAILAPACVTLGFMFALSCRVLPAQDPALKIGRVYILESVGAAFGGLLTSLLLVKHFNSIEILTGLAALNMISCAILTSVPRDEKAMPYIKTLSYIFLIAITASIVFGGFKNIDKRSLETQWRPLNLLVSKNSIYGNVSVTKDGSQTSFFTNGLHAFTVPDQLSREESVHFIFSQHNDPKDLLLIGGGAGGLLREIFKYDVENVDYVELDPLIIELSREFLSGPERHSLDDPRLNIVNTDGRFFIKNRSSLYDIIIISMPAPCTAQLNRFYTEEFFREARAVLRGGGVLSIGVTSSENYISPELGDFLSSIDRTLKNVFEDVAYVPGDTAYFMAAAKRGLITVDPGRISSTVSSRNINTGFMSSGYLLSKLSKDRLDYTHSALGRNRGVSANRDFRPISYYYDMILWSAHFRSWMPRFINPAIIWSAFLAICIIVVAAGWVLRKNDKGRFFSMLTAIGTTGFSEITFELVVLLSFQIIYGFLYYKLGLILTSFMIGLFLGSAYITKRLKTIKDAYAALLKIQVGVVIYPLLLPVIFLFLAQAKSSQASWLGSNLIFPSLPVIAGFIGGLQFPLGGRICLANIPDPGKAGALAYAVDLIGACAGAVLVSAFLMPVLGIFQTCAAVGLLNFSVLLVLFINRRCGDRQD